MLIFELMFGVTPFFNRNKQMLQSKILHTRVVFPDKKTYHIEYSDDLVDIVQKLLTKDRTVRLGAEGDMKELLKHPWFKGIDVKKLEGYQVQPPFMPKLDLLKPTQFFNVSNNLKDTVLPVEKIAQINHN